jgi:hypothetical protein
MPPDALYRIPIATGPVRLLMGGVCLVFVVPIFAWWLPKIVKFLRDRTVIKNAVVTAIFLLPIALGFAPLIILVTLITSPTTFVTETGLMRESVFYGGPVSFAWKDIDHVDCYSTRDGRRIRIITIVGSDGKIIQIGNASGVDLNSVRELMQNQLGPRAMYHCRQTYGPSGTR